MIFADEESLLSILVFGLILGILVGVVSLVRVYVIIPDNALVYQIGLIERVISMSFLAVIAFYLSLKWRTGNYVRFSIMIIAGLLLSSLLSTNYLYFTEEYAGISVYGRKSVMKYSEIEEVHISKDLTIGFTNVAYSLQFEDGSSVKYVDPFGMKDDVELLIIDSQINTNKPRYIIDEFSRIELNNLSDNKKQLIEAYIVK